MISIFYDLETTDLLRVGQILNFAFVAVDESFNVIDSLAADVKISRLQLPRVGAILTNRINVIEHQKQAVLSEKDAVDAIQNFFTSCVEKSDGSAVPCIGFNSSSFDLDYLRTVFIRNGESPYNTKITHKDLLLVARFLMAKNERFREFLFQKYPEDGENKLNLKLATLCKIHDLLDEEQAHESLADVKLTIALAKLFAERYDCDVRLFEPYQVQELHTKPKGSVFVLEQPLMRRFNPEKSVQTYPATLLDYNQRYALWIDLTKFKPEKSVEENQKCIRWKKYTEHLVLNSSEEPIDPSAKDNATKAIALFEDLNLSNYFTEKNCDVEQFIYKIHPADIEQLGSAQRSGNLPENASSDFKQLCRRFKLENGAEDLSEELLESLKRYADYRYGGKLILSEKTSSSKNPPDYEYHPTLSDLYQEIEEAAQKAIQDSRDEDVALINSLKEFYMSSDIDKLLQPV